MGKTFRGDDRKKVDKYRQEREQRRKRCIQEEKPDKNKKDYRDDSEEDY